MAEQEHKDDKLNIRLHVYDEEINVTINRQDEEYYRAAAKQITDRYNVYAKLFKGTKGDHTIALMTLVDIALQFQMEHARNDVAPYNNVLKRLTAEIEDAIGERH